MKISDFVSLLAKKEGKKKEVSVGNIREVLRIANEETKGELYKTIKKL